MCVGDQETMSLSGRCVWNFETYNPDFFGRAFPLFSIHFFLWHHLLQLCLISSDGLCHKLGFTEKHFPRKSSFRAVAFRKGTLSARNLWDLRNAWGIGRYRQLGAKTVVKKSFGSGAWAERCAEARTTTSKWVRENLIPGMLVGRSLSLTWEKNKDKSPHRRET